MSDWRDRFASAVKADIYGNNTVRKYARRYRVKQSDIIDAAEDSEDIGMAVGFSLGSAYGEFDNEGDWVPEWYGDDNY